MITKIFNIDCYNNYSEFKPINNVEGIPPFIYFIAKTTKEIYKIHYEEKQCLSYLYRLDNYFSKDGTTVVNILNKVYPIYYLYNKVFNQEEVNNMKWKQIEGYEGLYDVSDLGMVRSYYKTGTNKICDEPQRLLQIRRVKMLNDGTIVGEPEIALFKGKKRKLVQLKRLVAEAFLKDLKPNDKSRVVRKDNRFVNNVCVMNLEWK